jgi:hypothetical protein
LLNYFSPPFHGINLEVTYHLFEVIKSTLREHIPVWVYAAYFLRNFMSKFVITVAISVNAKNEPQAERCLESALDEQERSDNKLSLTAALP